MGLQYICDYKDKERYRLSFNELAQKTFGIDFEKWYQMGFWDDRYVCFSYADEERIISNISASVMDLLLYGKRISAVQIGTVMTHPSYRGRGIAGKLMEEVIKAYDRSDIMFLFGLNNLHDFYTRSGFVPVPEKLFYSEVVSDSTKTCLYRKLNMSDRNDIDIISGLSLIRSPVSRILGAENDESIFRWHCLNDFTDDIYYIEDLDAAVIYRSKDRVFDIYDIVSEEKPDIKKIVNAILPEGEYEAVFHFTPEADDLEIKSRPVLDEDYMFFVRSKSVLLEGELFFPSTSRT